jgi:prephenate dehydrogenase
MFEHMALIGVGLIGGSMARAVRRQGVAERITGFTASVTSGSRAVELGVVDEIADSIKNAVAPADIVVLATPMKAMESLLPELASALGSKAILTDVGSVKQSLISDIERICPELLPRFVPAHPIAGIEASGVDASFAELFQDKNIVLTPTAEVDPDSVARVKEMWERLGGTVLTLSADEHDRIFARTSHLPHLVAYSLVDYMAREEDSERLFHLAAGGFYDFTRIASSDPVMWRDICLTNRQAILDSLAGYRGAVSKLEELIERSDSEGIEAIFSSSKQARDRGLEKKRL